MATSATRVSRVTRSPVSTNQLVITPIAPSVADILGKSRSVTLYLPLRSRFDGLPDRVADPVWAGEHRVLQFPGVGDRHVWYADPGDVAERGWGALDDRGDHLARHPEGL